VGVWRGGWGRWGCKGWEVRGVGEFVLVGEGKGGGGSKRKGRGEGLGLVKVKCEDGWGEVDVGVV